MQHVTIQTRWAKEVSPDNALREYPRPQMERNTWTNLNGLWSYAITKKDAPKPASFSGEILVPYPIESALSGVKKALMPDENLWYKRSLNYVPKAGTHTVLNFGAVDYQCWIYVNGTEVGNHEGGYTAFSLDITHALKSGKNELVVKVYDPSDAGIGPRGKQVLNPKDIYYTPSSGIWQTVWLEEVPEKYITGLEITPDVDASSVLIKVNSKSDETVSLIFDGKSIPGRSNQLIRIPVKNAKLWSPASPYLYDLEVKLGADVVKSYFGMRKISVAKDDKGIDRIMLNDKPYYNLGTLDQGFWPDGLYTAPTDEALAFDIKAIKAMGFNTIRKHIKIEPARWYYHADKIGMLVWQDFVQPNPGLPAGAKEIFEKQGAEMLSQLHNSPSIVTWVLFNEKWGQYDQARLSKWVKEKDPSRILDGHTGEYLYVNGKLRSPSPDAYVNADITDVHAYPDPMNSIKMDGKAQVCGEFGGIGVFIPEHQWLTGSAWGYIQEKPAALKAKYEVMNSHLQIFYREGLSGSIYTQPFDVEGEQNGLMTYDREVIKIPFAELRRIHSALNPDVQVNASHDPIAKDADLTEPAQLYADAITLYIKGNRDERFLKKLVMMAGQNNDLAGKERFGNSYLDILGKPYSSEELAAISEMTTKTTDRGFAILLEQAKNNRKANVKAMSTIYADVIFPFISKSGGDPDWEGLESLLKPYGDTGVEIYLRAKTISALEAKNWEIYKVASKAYLDKFGDYISPDEKERFLKATKEN
ncbi:glycoside hydrolase family 2 [Pedobacter paludis]|uniref:Glycoside hydrolase family 2 n=2 Tax=Pedobacter paludis TaxID=2203212 RepID=A0A317F318_9SPHI|nr:glycoside hydrolase family 2 [Pedobacter paludis]